MITTYAVLVTRENIDPIIADAAKFNLNVDGEVQGSLEEAQDFGEMLYAIFSVNVETKQATFTTMWSTDFASTWYFSYGRTYGIWREVKLDTIKRP